MSDEQPKTISPHQVVAANLHAARVHRGWTQEEAAERLEPYLGTRWSKATFSAAERSVSGDRVRQFTAGDLVAFAQAFELPVTFFLLPPLIRLPAPDGIFGQTPPVTTNPQADQATLQPDQLIDVVLGDINSQVELLEVMTDQLPSDLRTGVAGALQGQLHRLVMATVNKTMGEVGEWAANLRSLADMLDHAVQETAEQAVADVEQQLFGDEDEGEP